MATTTYRVFVHESTGTHYCTEDFELVCATNYLKVLDDIVYAFSAFRVHSAHYEGNDVYLYVCDR